MPNPDTSVRDAEIVAIWNLANEPGGSGGTTSELARQFGMLPATFGSTLRRMRARGVHVVSITPEQNAARAKTAAAKRRVADAVVQNKTAPVAPRPVLAQRKYPVPAGGFTMFRGAPHG